MNFKDCSESVKKDILCMYYIILEIAKDFNFKVVVFIEQDWHSLINLKMKKGDVE